MQCIHFGVVCKDPSICVNLMTRAASIRILHSRLVVGNTAVIGCVIAMKMRLRTLLHSHRSQADAVGSYAKSIKRSNM
jgi:hypothetical protein